MKTPITHLVAYTFCAILSALVIWTFWPLTLKFEDKKAEEVQYNVTTNINRGTVEFINGKTLTITDVLNEHQKQLIELRARLNEIERKAFEKEKSK